MSDEFFNAIAKSRCKKSHLDFTKYFFQARNGSPFRVNWHHHYICDALDEVISGKTQNLIINVAPGSSKTELVVINFICRGLALNPMARFLHLSYSDDLALLNSQMARELIRSEEFQCLWPLEIAGDTKSKKRWNVMHNGKLGGGVYATSLSGQVTGFRAGHMIEGFQGAIVIDDPMKPEDAYSKTKVESANRRLLSTVQSRKANPKTPIVIIMQRLSETDTTGFIEKGGLPGIWKLVKIPALMDETDEYVQKIPAKYQSMIDKTTKDKNGRYSYWEYKEPIADLNEMESGKGTDQEGNHISQHVFNGQWQQRPVAMGGNLIKGKHFVYYKELPKIKYRKVYADTAQKTAEHNDYSVFECWGMGDDGKVYLLDMIRGKWESPDLRKRARAFWVKHSSIDHESGLGLGQLREMKVEDKSSGTDLVQTLKVEKPQIPIKGIERNKDKYTRVLDALPYIEAQLVCIPEGAPFTNDFVTECESFKADMTHAHDDQVDPMLDAIEDMLSTQNKIKVWENLGG